MNASGGKAAMRLLTVTVSAAVGLAAGAPAQERVYETPTSPYGGIESERLPAPPPRIEDGDRAEGETARRALVGGPEPAARTERVHRAVSSHIPADAGPRPPVIIDVIVDAPRRRPWFGRRPGPRRGGYAD